MGGGVKRVLLGTEPIGPVLELSFINYGNSDFDLVVDHWADNGTVGRFDIPPEVLGDINTTAIPTVPIPYQWRYLETMNASDFCEGHTIRVPIIREPIAALRLPGANLDMPMRLIPGVQGPLQPGATLEMPIQLAHPIIVSAPGDALTMGMTLNPGAFTPPAPVPEQAPFGSNVNPNIALSNGGRTAISSGAITLKSVQIPVGKSSGKWYFEINVITLTSGFGEALVGVTQTFSAPEWPINDYFCGDIGTGGIGYGYEESLYRDTDGTHGGFEESFPGTGLPSPTAPFTIMVAVDFDTVIDSFQGFLWWGINGQWATVQNVSPPPPPADPENGITPFARFWDFSSPPTFYPSMVLFTPGMEVESPAVQQYRPNGFEVWA